jgi:HEAT repeat protein
VATLLIELGRAVKACRFFAPDRPERKAALERSFRVWQSELARRGALDLALEGGAFRATGAGEPAGIGPLAELARVLAERGASRLRVGPALELDAFVALAGALARDPDELAEAGGLAQVAARAAAGSLAFDGAAAEAPAPQAAPEPAPAPPRARAAADDDADLPAPKRQTLAVDPLAALGDRLRAGESEERDGELRPEPALDPGGELVSRLRALDECRQDARYTELLQGIAADSAAHADGRPCDDVYRVILVLSSHATDSLRSERQRTLAEDALFQLASGARLDDIVQRACAPGPLPSVRATQILLQLGAHAVPRLLDALLGAGDPERRGRINAILIAMGDKAAPEVRASLERLEPERARIAARVAGDMQNPALVPYLRNALKDATAPIELARELARALARIGGRSAEQALAEALASPRVELAALAASCFSAGGSPRVFDALAAALARALRDDLPELAREAIRALGRLGRPEAVPLLEDVLGRRALLGRRKLRELKLAAAAALGRIPGEAARACLARTAARGDAQVRRAAQAALVRGASGEREAS